MKNRQGKFIVIDGTDGSGKDTQTKLLAKKIIKAGFNVKIVDFPQYNTKSAGLVEEYLSGKYGSPEEVGPYKASIFYACDRYDASFQIKKWLKQDKIVISNRYVTANMGHQGGKIKNSLERKKYFDWLYKLEYEIFNIPQPDLNIILHVNAEISQLLAQQRQKQDWINKTNDIHQNNLDHLKKAEQTYLQIAKNFHNFILIECVKNNQILSREQISNLIWKKIIKLLKPI
ncbi:MAG: dTMP kinase [Patescibacteria group bacterium]